MIVTIKKCNFRINIGGHEISQKECIGYLGVMLDDSLFWKQHIAHISSNYRMVVGRCLRLENVPTHKWLKSVFCITLSAYSILYDQLGMCC